MLLCDPFLRTLLGFQVLIESQWVAFGHKFASRSSGGAADHSPVFLQWLDCCWQLLVQQPQAFEFTERFLFRIAREVYAGRFGTFLANSASERAEKFQPFTQSLWSDINSRASEQQQYLRSDFRHSFASAPMWATAAAQPQAPSEQLKWNFSPANLKVCRDLHCFWQ
jgi:myotubularin-related protein 1/2